MLFCNSKRLSLIGVMICFSIGATSSEAGQREAVHVDVPAMVVAEDVQPSVVGQPSFGGRFVRMRFKVSTFVDARFDGAVAEYGIQVVSPQQTMRVVDFWPRTVTYSDIDGSVSVQESAQKHKDLKLDVNGGFQPFVAGTLQGNIGSKNSTTESYQRKAPSRELVNSGTSHRGFGAFYKFRPGPVVVAEGARDIAILVEVPKNWRGDLLQVQVTATGYRGGNRTRTEHLGGARNWVAIHQAGDSYAAQQVRAFVRQEQRLLRVAQDSQKQVSEKSLPTVWHRIGAALDVVDPKIPSNYLHKVIFRQQGGYLEGNTHRLPMEVRVAILDYWETQDAVFQLATNGQRAGSQLLASKP